MLILYLGVENFGPFQGPCRLDLGPSTDGKKPLVLIGGDNGHGKTSLLTAVKLCLYGKRASELWEGGQQGYRQFISEKFNNPAFDRGERQMIFELGLRIWENRIPHDLTVRRSYQLTDSRLLLTDNQETLEVLRDGKPWERPLPDMPEEDEENQYGDLLRLLIPPHLAQFYFFDGERVRELFRKVSAENISTAIRDLLGLSLFERLTDDMRDYRRFTIPRLYGKHQEKQAALMSAQGDRERMLGEIKRIESELADVEEDLKDTVAKIEAKENEFRRLGGIQQSEVDKIKEQEQQCKLESDRLSGDLKEALGDQVSVAFLLNLRQGWEERMRGEGSRRQWLTKREAIEPYIGRLVERLVGKNAPQPEPSLTPGQVLFFQERIEQEVKALFYPPPREASDSVWFDLRQEEIDQIRKLFDEALHFSAGRLREIVEAKQRVNAQRRRLLEKLQGLGDTAQTQAIAKEIRELIQERGSLDQRRADLLSDIEHQKIKLAEIERQITNLQQECGKSSKGQAKTELASRVEDAVKTYLSQVSVRKAQDIETHLNELFLAMANCRDDIRALKLNRQTYEIEVVDKEGRRLPIETGLGAGQSQVLAMAFVGALAKASGRILPRIIDTPLGRLDVNHRRDVTRYFFIEHAAPQTIILSTPTEINNCVYDNQPLRLLDDLRPCVARVLTLVKKAPGKTVVEPHYFGNKL